MPFNREPLALILDRVYNNYVSLFKPLDKTPRYNLLNVFAHSDAGMYHQLLGDLSFLADQLFPDTATGEYLRLHWSDRVPPLYAISAAGTIEIPGVPNTAVPAGLVYASPAGQRYFTEQSYRVGAGGNVTVRVKSETSGSDANLGPEQQLTLVSSIPPGIDSTALTVGGGITGGADGETDGDYLARVLLSLQNAARYGKPGDFASWAVDSSPAVSKAWEIKNFGVFGALLIQVIGGNHIDGITPVGNLDIVAEYINTVAPPILFTARTPSLLPLNLTVALLPAEDTLANREIVSSRLNIYLQTAAAPGIRYTAGVFRDALIDGTVISGGTVKLNGSVTGEITTTVLQLPVLGDVTWE
jgi:hypothetical protein